MKHVNARDVLPEKLLKEVQKYCAEYIYIPATREFYRRRRQEILRLSCRGLSTWAVARKVQLTERRVRQIIAKGEEGK